MAYGPASVYGCSVGCGVMPTLRNRSILITGGAGFIGSHLAHAVVPENDVTVVDNLSTGDRENVPDGVTFVRGDIRDDSRVDSLVDGTDIIFHQAAVVSVDRSVEAPIECHSVNVDGTLNVLEAAKSTGAKVVLASSAAVYGHPDSVPIDEGAHKRPTSPYGLDKLAIDQYARLYTDLYDIDTVVLRYFNVYGPGQPAGDYSGVISIFMDQARNDDPLTIHGDGSQTRDFVHISDVVQANLAAADRDVSGQAFNIGTGQATSIEELAQTVRDVVDAKSSMKYMDPRPGDIEHSQADISRARDRLGYEPSMELETGLSSLSE